MLYGISLLFFVLGLGSLAAGVFGAPGVELIEAQAAFTIFLFLSSLSLIAELVLPLSLVQHLRRKPDAYKTRS